MIGDVDQYNDLVMHYHGKVGLVDRLDYKLSTLSLRSRMRMKYLLFQSLSFVTP